MFNKLSHFCAMCNVDYSWYFGNNCQLYNNVLCWSWELLIYLMIFSDYSGQDCRCEEQLHQYTNELVSFWSHLTNVLEVTTQHSNPRQNCPVVYCEEIQPTSKLCCTKGSSTLVKAIFTWLEIGNGCPNNPQKQDHHKYSAPKGADYL